MRVRKSVPEGYKTGTYSAFDLFDETDQHHYHHHSHSSHAKLPKHTAPSTRAPSSQRELLPFCGINKIGGLSFPSPEEQPQPSFTFTTVPPLDDVPSLSSSQDSLASTASSTASAAPLSVNTAAAAASLSRKRLHAGDAYGNDDDDGEAPSVSDCLHVPSGEWMDGQVSPRSLVPSGSGWENTRVMAVPRKIRRSLGLVAVPTAVVAGAGGLEGVKGSHLALGQENMVVDEDFPEADFLDYEVLQGDEMEI